MSDDAVRLGWWLSSEEQDPRQLVAAAQLAEASGFETAMISDHLQPWVTAQGHAGHVWTTVGAIAQATDHLEVGTGRLNEQAFGQRWPSPGERRRWLGDAIDVIRRVWTGDLVSISDGRWRVEGFRLFERPAAPPPIYVATSGRRTAKLAGSAATG
jgi:coenzyme F420-dependent glucose-6-phosphate dehydrogenase